MSIFVSEIYRLSTLQQIQILTKQSGYQNMVSHISILDHEFVSSQKGRHQFLPNDFVITSFLFAKDDPTLMCDAIRLLIASGVSMLGIKSVYYKALPQSIIDYAVENHFSIFLFGHDTYYENIIIEVTDTLRLAERNQVIQSKVEQLLRFSASCSSVGDMALEINDNFCDCFMALYLRIVRPDERDSLYRTLERLKRLDFFRGCHSIFKYGEGLMSILTFPEGTASVPRAICQEFWGRTGLSAPDYYMGASDIFPQLHCLNLGIRQSLYACEVSRLRKKPSAFFRDIGLFQLILPFMDTPWLESYYSHIINPILQYDAAHDTDLLATAAAYVAQDGVIKKTAEALYQHESTVRYRIRKLRELLNMQDETDKFYPQLCFAMQIYLLKTLSCEYH